LHGVLDLGDDETVDLADCVRPGDSRRRRGTVPGARDDPVPLSGSPAARAGRAGVSDASRYGAGRSLRATASRAASPRSVSIVTWIPWVAGRPLAPSLRS
jgi:hypothetical protein